MNKKAQLKGTRVADFLPAWTRRAVIESTGRDPLGLLSIQLYFPRGRFPWGRNQRLDSGFSMQL